jgi:REP element-mobilizing transposase RayT
MARPLRVQVAGGFFHVTARGNRRQPIFMDNVDVERFIAILAEVAARYGWRLHAYCLMTNHYHLLVETPEANLSAGFHRLNFLYAQWFNRRRGLDGHLFQGRFHSVLIERQEHLVELARYIVLNPVRAGLCRHPGEWRWSSYRAVAGRARPAPFLTVAWLLDQFGETTASARAAYRQFAEEACPRAPPADTA